MAEEQNGAGGLQPVGLTEGEKRGAEAPRLSFRTCNHVGLKTRPRAYEEEPADRVHRISAAVDIGLLVGEVVHAAIEGEALGRIDAEGDVVDKFLVDDDGGAIFSLKAFDLDPASACSPIYWTRYVSE